MSMKADHIILGISSLYMHHESHEPKQDHIKNIVLDTSSLRKYQNCIILYRENY